MESGNGSFALEKCLPSPILGDLILIISYGSLSEKDIIEKEQLE